MRILASIAILSAAVVATAQDAVPTAITLSNSTGDQPYSTQIGSSTEHIELSNGNLIITIPIVSVPGRKLDFDYALRYDAAFWIPEGYQTTGVWKPEQRNWLTQNTLGWTTNQPYSTQTTGLMMCLSDGAPGQGGLETIPQNFGGSLLNNPITADASGVKHVIQSNLQIGACEVGNYTIDNSEGPDVDESGFWGSNGALVSPASTHYDYGGFSGGQPEDPTGRFGNMAALSDARGNAVNTYPGGIDTVGRVPLHLSQPNANQLVYSTRDSNGNQVQYSVTLTNLSVNTDLGVPDGSLYVAQYIGTRQVIQSIQTPAGNYSFSYNADGEIYHMSMPTGVTVDYDWEYYNYGCSNFGSPTQQKRVVARTVHNGSHVATWTFSYCGPTKVIFPANASGIQAETDYGYGTFTELVEVKQRGAVNGPVVRQYDMLYDSQSVTNPAYTGAPTHLHSITTTLDDGSVSKKEFDYDLFPFLYNFNNCIGMQNEFLCQLRFSESSDTTQFSDRGYAQESRGNVTAIREYGWGSGTPGALLRQTLRTYLTEQNPLYFQEVTRGTPDDNHVPSYIFNTHNLVNRVASETVYDGSVVCSGVRQTSDAQIILPPACTATKLSETKLVYDNGSPATYGYFGEVTSASKWLRTPDGAESYLTTNYSYDAFGNLLSVTDANRNRPTIIGYADSVVATSVQDCAIASNSHAYPTSITDALGHQTQLTYYPCTGMKASVLGPNDIASGNTGTRYQYETLGRPVDVWSPDGGHTHTAYDDTALTVTTTTDISVGNQSVHVARMDALGQTVQTKLASDPQGPVYVDTTYDLVGNVASTSNPYRSLADSTYGLATFSYDGLQRKTGQQNPDGTSSAISYSGASVRTTDEANNTWIRNNDVFGSLIQLTEPTALQTTYSYDLMGNLRGVNQLGNSAPTCSGNLCSVNSTPDTPRTRSFVYDSLSRLVTSTNPETGTICYGTWLGGACTGGYDANGNLLHKTNANRQTIDYTYDALNRLTSKTSAQDTETNFGYIYDQGANGIGRLSYEYRPNVAATEFFYDSMGRIVNKYWFGYSYNAWLGGIGAAYDLAGNITRFGYPYSPRTIQQVWDSAGHLASVQDITGGTQGKFYFNNATYSPSGVLTSATLGNGVTESMSQNTRLQPCRTWANSPVLAQVSGGDNLYDRQAFFQNPSAGAGLEQPCGRATANNGNIYSIMEMNVAGTPSQNFGYDSLNRLTGAYTTNRTTANSYNHTYNYDSFGNMLKHDAINGDLSYAIDASTNRLTLNGNLSTGDLRYDNAGNLVTFPNPLGAPRNAIFTAEGDIRCISDGANPCGLASYLYNGSGERVFSAPNNQFSQNYMYFNSQMMEEINVDASIVTDYIYANGQKIAKVDTSKPLYQLKGTRTADTLACGIGVQDSAATPVLSSIGTIQPNDMLFVDMLEPVSGTGGATMGGIFVQLDGQYWAPTDSQGVQSHVLQATDGLWHHRSFAIGQQAAGHALTWLGINMNNPTPAGNWEIDYANLTYVKGDGTVFNIPIEADGMSTNPQTTCASTNLTGATATLPVVADEGTTYFLDDHLGTTQMELSSGGWPIWQGWFTPFGQELGQIAPATPVGNQRADGTNMRFKFTGKERDAESGLDYFGARYYASSMGRFMSPDWAAQAQPVPYAKLDNPQSLNLYSYVYNNPLSKADPDGHDTCGSSNGGVCDAAQHAPTDGHVHAGDVAGGMMAAGALYMSGRGLAAGASSLWGMGTRAVTAAYLGLSVMGTQAAQNLVSARDAVTNSLSAISNAASSGEIKVDGNTLGRLGSTANALAKGMTNSDINGAVKQAATGVEAGGDHLAELGQAANSMSNLSQNLTRALGNSNLPDQTRTLYTNAVNAMKPAIEHIKDLQH